MANLQNNLLVEVEELLDFYLNKKSMTNKQALKQIEKTGVFLEGTHRDDYQRKRERSLV